MAVKSVSIRIKEEMLEKIGFVADYEGRSVNSHILVLVRDNTRAFEAQHGKIEGQISPDVNVRSPGAHKNTRPADLAGRAALYSHASRNASMEANCF